MRLTPTHVPEKVVELLREQFVGRQEDDTFGAKVEFEITDAAPGFCAPDLPQRIKEIVNDSSQLVYGRQPIYTGAGGAIPFMSLFSDAFPNAKFLLSGVDGISNNAHAANENIDLEQCNKFTQTLAIILSKI